MFSYSRWFCGAGGKSKKKKDVKCWISVINHSFACNFLYVNAVFPTYLQHTTRREYGVYVHRRIGT